MQIIDAHIHADFDSQWLKRIGYYCGVDFSSKGLTKEMESCNVTHCVSMGLRSLDLGMDIHAPTPYETAENLRLPDITYIGGINPFFGRLILINSFCQNCIQLANNTNSYLLSISLHQR